jgi:hypothetical protein
MSEEAISVWEFVISTAAALVLGVGLSMGAVYSLNRVFDAYGVDSTVMAGPVRGP